MSFREAFNAAVDPQGRRASWHPLQYIEAWRALVDEVAAGYSGDLYEYENDLSVRDDLQVALNTPDLGAFPEWVELQVQVGKVDSLLRDLLSVGPEVRPDSAWWRARLPAHAGSEFAQDVERLFGVEIRYD